MIKPALLRLRVTAITPRSLFELTGCIRAKPSAGPSALLRHLERDAAGCVEIWPRPGCERPLFAHPVLTAQTSAALRFSEAAILAPAWAKDQHTLVWWIRSSFN